MSEVINVNRPSFLANKEVEQSSSMQRMATTYSKPPTIKVIQAQTGAPYKPPFKEADIVIIPNGTKIGDLETPFIFVPLVSFDTFVALNPYAMKGQLPAVREYSFDANSELAKKCKAFTEEPCPENKSHNIKYSTQLNFLIAIQDSEFSTTPVHLRCARGEFKYGQILLSLIQGRWNQAKVPSYGCLFRGVGGQHSNNQFQWKGIDFLNAPVPFIESEELFDQYHHLSDELDKIIQSRQLELEIGDDEVETSTDAAAETKY